MRHGEHFEHIFIDLVTDVKAAITPFLQKRLLYVQNRLL